MTSSTEPRRVGELGAARHLERHVAPRRACAWRARSAGRRSPRGRGRPARSPRWSARRACAASAPRARRSDSTGWQVVKIRPSRSSPIWSSIAASRSGGVICCSSRSRPISSCLRWSVGVAAHEVDRAVLGGGHEPGARVVRDARLGPLLQRRRPARPGRGPRPGRRRRTMRARPAISRGDSIRQTASIAPFASRRRHARARRRAAPRSSSRAAAPRPLAPRA